jgi:hypothetical protein
VWSPHLLGKTNGEIMVHTFIENRNEKVESFSNIGDFERQEKMTELEISVEKVLDQASI